MNILVLCTGNSARSILLEHILNARSGGQLRAFSAGSRPTGVVHPHALALLARKGIDAGAARSKSWNVFAETGAPEMDAVITVCGSAAEETCPVWPGAPVRAHWGVADPAAADTSVQGRAFREAFDILSRRADAFLATKPAGLGRVDLEAALEAAGKVA